MAIPEEPLDASGERVDVDQRPRTHNEQAHLRRYEWAAQQASGRVLDVACGTGYGSRLLASTCQVDGLDSNGDAVAVAQRRVRDGRFVVAELPGLPYGDAVFDAVVSFETVEHVEDDISFVAEIRRVLRPGGLLLLSTPNAAVTSPTGVVANPWHVREYTLGDLYALLDSFDRPEVFGQGRRFTGLRAQATRVVARFPWLCRPGRWWDVLAHGRDSVEPWVPPWQPTVWVLRCRR